MKRWFAITAAILLGHTISFSQVPAAGNRQTASQQPPQQGQGQRANMPQPGHLYGKLLDATTGKPIPYASVAVLRARDSSVITGMLSKTNGEF
ncbi:MAG TPA: hypothetical protein VM802_23080, partial [Chitinophaga sp.]|uniref:hypothetical protein n=1 Tax=Chitinophaga sp. TaxID=1869181 RepID=UPI002C5ED325